MIVNDDEFAVEHGGLVFVNFCSSFHESWPVDLGCFTEDLGVDGCARDDDFDFYAACKCSFDGGKESVVRGEVGVLDEDGFLGGVNG